LYSLLPSPPFSPRRSHDLEYELERFAGVVEASAPTSRRAPGAPPPPGEVAAVAVDALARLCLNLPDGAPLGAEDAALVEDAVAGGLWDAGEGFRGEVRAAIAAREGRAGAYV
jgi:hypothetical protein